MTDFTQNLPNALKLDVDSTTVESLQGGALLELANKALAKVIENVYDPNTPVDAQRGIDIKIRFKPLVKDRRDNVGCSIQAKPILAPHAPVETTLIFGKKGQTVSAFENNPAQLDFLNENAKEEKDVRNVS